MLHVKEAHFVKSVSEASGLPKGFLPHCCFAGRSNAGKSSMINTLTGRKNLARTGKTPGLTRQINFFSINDKLLFADLPGYGFSSAPRAQSQAWRALIESYLRDTPGRKLVFLLVDARRGVNEDDASLYEWLGYFQVPVRVVASKMDLISKNLGFSTINNIVSALHLDEAPLLFSAKDRTGVPELWKVMEKWLG